jgi:hypothetical protein
MINEESDCKVTNSFNDCIESAKIKRFDGSAEQNE